MPTLQSSQEDKLDFNEVSSFLLNIDMSQPKDVEFDMEVDASVIIDSEEELTSQPIRENPGRISLQK